MKSTVGITLGDPKGIGPEVVVKSWKVLSKEMQDRIIMYGDYTIMERACELTHTKIAPANFVTTSSNAIALSSMEDPEAARCSIAAIDAACADIKHGRINALVTAPISKRRTQSVHKNFFGHTEYLAKLAKVSGPVMMFAPFEQAQPQDSRFSKAPCFSLVTMHLSLKDVARAITKKGICNVIKKTSDALSEYFGIKNARIAVMSLNPHAGEGGALGHEEKHIIKPAIDAMQKHGINCHGPIAADALFRNLKDFDYDAVIAMYHDQALIPAKLLYQSGAVNVTLGLPYVRTSPGHGTAEDIAWFGKADESAMLAAIRLALRLVG